MKRRRVGMLTIWVGVCLVGLVASSLGVDASVTTGTPQQTQSPEYCFEAVEKEYLTAIDPRTREELLVVMYQDFDAQAFKHVYAALMSDSGQVQEKAATLIGGYYLKVAVYADDDEHVNPMYSEEIRSQRSAVVSALTGLATSKWVVLRIDCLRSLIRMGEADDRVVDELYRIAMGENKEQWKYACLECWGEHSKEDIDSHQQKDAAGLLLRLRRLALFSDKLNKYLPEILERIETQSRDAPSPAYEIMKRAIEKELGVEKEDGDCRAKDTYHDAWVPWKAAIYSAYWCGSLRNSTDPHTCDPYQDYSDRGGDCANFASQCLSAGELIACASDNCDQCNPGYCCVTLAERLKYYLENRLEYVVSTFVAWTDPNTPEPWCEVPLSFDTGDVAVLHNTSNGRWHAVVNRGGSGGNALYDAHTGDQCGVDLNWFIGTGSNEFQEAYFFHIVPHLYCDTWGCLKDYFGETESLGSAGPSALSSHDNTLVWNVPPHDPADYLIFKATDSDGDEDFVQIGSRLRQDTVFVDDATAAGHLYHYRVVSLKGDTLMECNLGSAGLKTVGEILPLPELLYNSYSDAMVTEGSNIYLASYDHILKADAGSPQEPQVVGSTTIPCGDWIEQSALLNYQGGEHLLCLVLCESHAGHLYVFDTSASLSLEGQLDNFAPQGHIDDVTAGDNGFAYVACSRDGIIAVDLRNPATPSIVARYYGTGNNESDAVEWVKGDPRANDYLYWTGSKEGVGRYSEILELVFSPGGQFSFASVCTSEDSECWPPGVHLEPIVRGKVRGPYGIGLLNGTRYCVLDVSNPTQPSVLKPFTAPYDELPGLLPYISYEFDDRYLYVASQTNSGEEFGRSLYVLDLCSPDTVPQFAVGDTLGQSDVGRMASWGRHLYFWDNLITGPGHYPRLRVLEKAWGCDPVINVSVALSPPPDAYMAGEPVTISWECSGCPIDVEVTLIEQGAPNQRRTIALQRKYEHPDLAASAVEWAAEGISEDFENHWYQIEVKTRNIEGDTDSRCSEIFRIVEGKSGTIAVNTTWSGIVFLRGDILVEPGVVLTVNPGTEIRVWPEDLGHTPPNESKITIQVRGALDVNGTAVSPVVFHSRTGATKWDWDGFYFDSQCTNAMLEHCVIKNAQEGIETFVTLLVASSVVDSCGTGLASYSGSFVVANSVISHCGYGVFVTAGPPHTASIIGTTIENCQFGIRAYGEGVVDVRNTACRENDYGLYTSSLGTVTVRENSSFKHNDIGIFCYGAPPSISPNITNCVIDSNTTHGIACHYFSGPTIESSDIRHNAAGVFCYDSSAPLIRENEITFNGDGIAAVLNSEPDVGTAGSYGNNWIQYNTGFHISNLTPGVTISAEYNYWGSSIPPGLCLPKANKFSGAVDYSPALCGNPLLASAVPGGAELVENGKNVPSRFALGPSSPNPFNPSTVVHFEVPSPGAPVDVRIYNVMGQLVRLLVAEHKNPGTYNVVWDGRDMKGQSVASSVYFVRMKSIDFEATLKIMLLK